MEHYMTKEVLISIKGLQFGEEDHEDELESITTGTYYYKNGSHYVLYEEATEGFDETSRNRLKFREHEMSLTKSGLVNVQMIFEENRKNMSSYHTPYGDIMIGIDTRTVEIEEKQEQINLKVDYALEVNYQHFADCKIEICIRPKQSGVEL